MKKKKSKSFDLPPDLIESMPFVHIKGMNEVIIDGKCKLIDYSYEKIVFDVFYRGKYLYIEGENMTMRCCIKNIIEIGGVIHSVRYDGRQVGDA